MHTILSAPGPDFMASMRVAGRAHISLAPQPSCPTAASTLVSVQRRRQWNSRHQTCCLAAQRGPWEGPGHAAPKVSVEELSPEALQGVNTVPGHIAVIMDGNGRWANSRGWPATAGHEAGTQSLKKLVKHCTQLGVRALTVFAFSSENWNRPAAEVDFLMRLFERTIKQYIDELEEKGVRVMFIGDRQQLPGSLTAQMEIAEQRTCDNSKMLLTIALAYSARDDLTGAARRIAALAAQGLIQPNKVDATLLEQHLSTATVTKSVGPPDLLIRTSGEQRVSNFMLFELAYTEFYFTEPGVHWPDFDAHHLAKALEAYSSRQRRYGLRL